MCAQVVPFGVSGCLPCSEEANCGASCLKRCLLTCNFAGCNGVCSDALGHSNPLHICDQCFGSLAGSKPTVQQAACPSPPVPSHEMVWKTPEPTPLPTPAPTEVEYLNKPRVRALDHAVAGSDHSQHSE